MRRGLWLILLLLLVACGGGEDAPTTPTNPGTGNTPNTPPPSARGGSVSGSLIAPGFVGGPEQTARAEVVPGEVIIKFKSDLTIQSLSLSGTSLQRVKSLASIDAQLYRAGPLSQQETRQLAADLSKRGDVEYAHPNWILRAFAEPNDEFYAAQWHYQAMNLPAAWDIENGSSKRVVVAVIDSGVVQHPDLTLQLEPGYDFVSDPANSGDGNGRDADPLDQGGKSAYHGSHVAGTIGASTNNGEGVAGVNWNARILPVRALGVSGGGSFTDILEGLVWAVGGEITGVTLPPAPSTPATVVNLSLGANIGQPCPSNVQQLFKQLADANIMVVVAAGNANEDMSTTFPASCESVITVGATGPTGERAPYSNFGAGVDVMAPGGDVTKVFDYNGQKRPAGVLSTIFDDKKQANYAFYQGTSMAAPHIAGLVSLMLAKDPGLSFNEVLTRLKNAATPLSSSECSTSGCGAGFVDAAAALKGASGGGGSPQPEPPVTATNVYAFALYCLSDTCLDGAGKLFVDFDKSVGVRSEQKRNPEPYLLENLSVGRYLMAGWQDINGNEEIEDSEPFGIYLPLVNVTSGQNVSDIDILLEAATPTSQALTTTDFSGQVRNAANQLRH